MRFAHVPGKITCLMDQEMGIEGRDSQIVLFRDMKTLKTGEERADGQVGDGIHIYDGGPDAA